MEQSLPYRKRVEVVIRHDNNTFLLIIERDEDKKIVWAALPGGGIDDQNPEEACVNECLEELGIRIKNVESTGIHLKENHVSAKGDRRSEFCGSDTEWFVAEYDCSDLSKYNADNDSKNYALFSYEGADNLLRQMTGVRVPAQLEALARASTY